MSGYLDSNPAEVPKFSKRGGRNPFRHVLPGLIIVAGAVIAWYFAADRTPAPEAGETTVETEPVVKPEATEAEKSVATNAPAAEVTEAEEAKPEPQAEEPKNDPRFPYTDGRKVVSTRTNGWNQVVDICVMPNGKTRKVIRKAKPAVFTHASDIVLARALSGTMDEELPPMPLTDDLEEDFVESLKTPIVINDDDTEEVREMKRRVIDAREYIDAEMRNGRGFQEILAEHIAQRKTNSEAREQAMTIVSELKESGDAETINEYVSKVNEMLSERGIGEISSELGSKTENGGSNE